MLFLQQPHKRLGAILLLIGILSIGIAAYVFWNGEPANEDGIEELQRQLEVQERQSEVELKAYVPKVRGRIDDLAVSAVHILRQLPGVMSVEVCRSAEPPQGRIIHLLDWHFVPQDLFAIDLRAAAKRSLSDAQLDHYYREHLLEVDLVQLEQLLVLRCLIKHHGLRRAHVEGLTREASRAFMERIRAARDVQQGLIASLDDVRSLLKTMEGREATERYQKAKAIEAEATRLLDEYKRNELLELGVIGRLVMAGELEEALPLEDAELLEKAKPVKPDGQMFLDPEKKKARNDAQIKMVKAQGNFGFVVLGGSHNLEESMRSLAPTWELLRVKTRCYRQVAESR